MAGAVAYLERHHTAEHIQRSVGDLRSVTITVTYGQTADYHVRITYGLHLVTELNKQFS